MLLAAVAAVGGVCNSTTVKWRGLRHLGNFLQHPLPSLEHLIAPLDSDQRAALELGCGEGHALLELQLRFPRAQCYCLNPETWTGKNTAWLQQEGTHYGSPLGMKLPITKFDDLGQLMPFADESLDFIYSQHALNRLQSPRTRFAPFMSEIARLLRPNGTALLRLIPCCLPRTPALKYGGKVVYSGSNSQRFAVLDDRAGCEAAGLERVTIFRALEFDPKSEGLGPYAFVLLVRKGTATSRCPTEGPPPPSLAARKRRRLDSHTAYLQEFLDAVHIWLHHEVPKQHQLKHGAPSLAVGLPSPAKIALPKVGCRRVQYSMHFKDAYLLTLYGNSSERTKISAGARAALDSWHMQLSGSLAKFTRRGASKFAMRLRSCARLKDEVFVAWHNATSVLVACQAAPAACSLCQFQDRGDRFFDAVYAAASLRRHTWAAPQVLWVLAALGSLVALLCRKYVHRCAAASAHWRRTPLNLLAVFWSQGQGFVHPLATVKLTVLLLLTVDLLGVGAPELNIVAAPELIARIRRHPVLPAELLPGVVTNLTGIFMPDLRDATADVYVAWLVGIRCVMLMSWALFLVLPAARSPWLAFGCYLLGAASYVILGSLALMYNLAHSTQSSILFVAASAIAVPGLTHNRRAAIWLRQFLFLCVIAPVYLFSGMSKIRYIGLRRQLTGAWMVEDSVLGSASMFLRSSLPSLNELVLHAPGGLTLMSLGNLAVEVVAPIGVLLSAPFSTAESISRAAMCLLALTFHSLVFLQMGPNFVRHCILVVIVLDPLSVVAHKSRPCATDTDYSSGLSPPATADRLRGAAATAVLVSWFYVQIHSDLSHLLGHTAPNQKIDSYWPIPEMSMFAKPSAEVSFRTTGGLATLLLAAFLHRVLCSAGGWLRRQHEATAAEVSAPNLEFQGSAGPR